MKLLERIGLIEVFFIIVIALVFTFVLFRGACVSKGQAIGAAESQGWSRIEVTSDHWLLVGLRGCSESDAAMFKATALNPKDELASITICCGAWFKNCTIRSD